MKKILAMFLSLMLMLSMTSVVTAEEEAVKLDFFVVSPWVSSEMPDPEIDIYKKWFADHFGVDVTLYNPAEGKTELLTRMTAGNAPDLIAFDGFTSMWEFYEQGVLLEDWNAYADKIPDYLTCMGDEQIGFYTRDGKLTAVAAKPGNQEYGWMIRKDWLAALNMEMPTNLDELYDVLYAFTYNDPDGNGVDDTYGITAAGGGKGVGELANLLCLFDNNSWYIGEDGTATNAILSGAYDEYLQFVKKLYDAGVIDPNWYTQGWEERKSQLFAGSYGMTWYPPLALYGENLSARKDEMAAEWWTVMPMFSGALPAYTITGAVTLSVSVQTAQDEAKMEKICEIINTMNPLHDEYYEIAHGVDFDGYRMKVLDDGTKYLYADVETWDPDAAFADGGKMRSSNEGCYLATAVYAQMWRATNADGTQSGGNDVEPNDFFIAKVTEQNKVAEQKHYSAESLYLNLDAAVREEAQMVQDEYTLNYILGETDDYEGFVENWLAAGGYDLIDQATEQFTDWGFIK